MDNGLTGIGNELRLFLYRLLLLYHYVVLLSYHFRLVYPESLRGSFRVSTVCVCVIRTPLNTRLTSSTAYYSLVSS